MRIALAADFHLDVRQFNRQQRWQDYVNTFAKVTKKIAEVAPDVYVIAGDLFERYSPHPGIIRRFLKEVSCLECPIILIKGNHDSPQIFFDRFGGDILHLLQDVTEIIYLNRENPFYEIGDVCFIGLGYCGFNASQEIARHVKTVKTELKTKIGVFHQLLDYPGVPENQVEVSRGFLKGLGLDYVLMGHWHVKYEEQRLYNPGSPEYWSFDQAEQIELNLDTGEAKTKPAKQKGFYLIDTKKDLGEFIDVAPARPMYCITYTTQNFQQAKHLPIIKNHIETYNVEGAMVKTIIKGRSAYARLTLEKTMALDKPLIHHVVTNLKPSDVTQEKIDSVNAQVAYLTQRGISKNISHTIAEWLEKNRSDLADMQSHELLRSLRAILKREGAA